MQNEFDAVCHNDNFNASSQSPRVIGVQSGVAHEFSKISQTIIRLIESFGVEGDVHAGRSDQHLFHIKRFGDQPNLRQVHLIQAEFFDDVSEEGHFLQPGDLGENITTRGVSLLNLPTGARLRLGAEAEIELTGLRNPCHQINHFQAGLLDYCKVATPEGVVRKAGVMAIVTKSGDVKPGDQIEVDLPSGPQKPLVYRTPLTDKN
ncbi:MOSC domain-containing protein [Tranquillimonas rosea]|uniref:MOSC domain-containing protein n=1 Tax=Tranquillimonas rosea TaxID=641238 RepID=UPI000B836A03|nr:MOSC domain-containing protein [Tranquillimonas rosea]